MKTTDINGNELEIFPRLLRKKHLIISMYDRDIGSIDLALNKEDAIALIKYLRNQFNLKTKQCNYLKKNGRLTR